MQNILYITDNLNHRSGISAVIMNLFRYFDKQQIHIDFLLWKDGNSDDLINEVISEGSKVFYMPRLSLSNYFRFVQFIKVFFKANQNKYDIVHSHFYLLDNIVFPVARKYGVKKCLSHSHNTKYSDSKLKSIRNWLLSLNLFKKSDACFACSNEAGVFLYGKMSLIMG